MSDKKSSIVAMSRERPCLAYVVREMCKRVNADPESIDFGANDWYRQRTWSRDDEQQFIKWMTVYLGKNVDARREIMDMPSNLLRSRRGVAQMFAFVYGWRLADEPQK